MTKPIDEFNYEEAPFDASGAARSMDHEHYCWMNAAYVLGTRLTDAFAQTGFCVAIRGAEGGGKVENLPFHVFTSDDGDLDAKCPTEIGITDRREFELSNLGFPAALPLQEHRLRGLLRGAEHAEAEEIRSPGGDRERGDFGTAALSDGDQPLCPLPEGHGARQDRQLHGGERRRAWLNRWIQNYVNSNESAGQEMKARYPLREARIEVREIPGRPGSYNAIAHLRPWLQMEELTTSMRLVARIPQRV